MMAVSCAQDVRDLPSILKSHGIEDLHMNIDCKDQLLLLVRDKISKSYNDIAPYFGLTEQEEHNIRDNITSSEEARKLQVLRKWRSKNGSTATCQCLAEAFIKMKDIEIAEFIVSYVGTGYFTYRHKQSHADHGQSNTMPNRALERFPSWEVMEHEEQERAKIQLFEENERIQEKYAHYFACICKELSSLSLDVNRVKLALALKMKVTIPEFESATTLDQLFLVIAKHTTWYNYRPLEYLVNVLNYGLAKKILMEYENTYLNPYLKQSIFLVPSTSLSPYASSSYVPCMMLFEDISELSGTETKYIEMRLAKQLKIPLLQLKSYDIGSVHLIFGIHSNIFEKNFSQEDSLLKKHIQWKEEMNSYVFTIDIFSLLLNDLEPEVQIIVNKCVSATREKLSKKIDELTAALAKAEELNHLIAIKTKKQLSYEQEIEILKESIPSSIDDNELTDRSIFNSIQADNRQKSDTLLSELQGLELQKKHQEQTVTKVCPTCQYVLHNPCLVGCCGKKVCQQCLPMEGQPCTHCGKANVKITEDKELKRDISFHKVFCSNEDNGCEWQGEVRAVEDHLQKACKHVTKPMNSKLKNGILVEQECPSKPAAHVAAENMLSHSKADKPRGYDYRLVEQDHKVMCPTCQYVLRDPCLIGCCGKKVCQQCLPMEGQPCTHCGEVNVEMMVDKELRRDISFCKVFCPNEDKGCEWQGELRAAEDHLQNGCNITEPNYDASAKEPPSKPAAYVGVVPEAPPTMHNAFKQESITQVMDSYCKALLNLEARMMPRFDQILDEVSKLQELSASSNNSYELQVKDKEISLLSMKCKAWEEELADKEHQVSELTEKVSGLELELEQVPSSLLKPPQSIKGESTPRELKIVVESAGWQAGDYCHFVIDEVPLKAEYGRGLNMVVLDPMNYKVTAIDTFDTWNDQNAITNFTEFIGDKAKSFSVICIAAKDEASRYLNNEGKRFIDDLANRTGKIYKLAHRDSYALVAIKDCPQHSAEVISPRDNKRAAHITYCLPFGGTRKLIGFKIDVEENSKITRNIAEKIVTFKA